MNRVAWIAAAVAACAASISPSQAFTDADLDRLAAEILESKTAPGVGDAINDLSSELIECSAITMVSAICIGKTPGQDSNTGQPLENISSWTGKLGVILGSGVGLSERALSTRLKVTADDIMRDVSSSCRNLSVLFERVRKSCEALVASPTNRLKQILVARQPSLYENDNEGVGAPSGPLFSPRAHCGLNATGVTSPIRRSLAAMSLFGILLLRNSAVSIATALMSR